MGLLVALSADLDAAVHAAVSDWLDGAWPFAEISYAQRKPPRALGPLG